MNGIMTADRLLKLMECGDIWIERIGGRDGFFYVVWRQSGREECINQDLAKQVVMCDPRIRSEEWREGWGHELRTIGKTRYVID